MINHFQTFGESLQINLSLLLKLTNVIPVRQEEIAGTT